MSDLIDREAALNCYHDWVDQYGDVHTPDEIPEYQAIEALPSVQPERKTAHWIEGRTDDPKTHNILCSNCFEGYPSRGHANSSYTRKKFKYCPNCGRRMIEQKESEANK